MINFNFDNQKVSLPEKWSEVTVSMFINEDFMSGDGVKLLASLAQIEPEKLYNTTEDLMPYLNKVSKFIVKNPNGWKGKDVVPTEFMLLDKLCKVPKDIELERLGQKIMLGQQLAKHKHSYLALPEAIAIYLAPQIYDDWFERIDEVADAVKEMRIADCWTLANFFLSDMKRSPSSGVKF